MVKAGIKKWMGSSVHPQLLAPMEGAQEAEKISF
jgi:hypothetical protein